MLILEDMDFSTERNVFHRNTDESPIMSDESSNLHIVTSVHGNSIRVTAKQWAHVIESHDYMAGNIDKILETLAEPNRIVEGKSGESLALQQYEATNITRKTAVIAYRDEPDGFLITAFFTSRPDKIERGRRIIWRKS